MNIKYIFGMVVLGILMPILQGCTTSGKPGVDDVLLSETNAPGGTVGCLSPKIVTQDGNCEEPKRLSWQ